MKRGHYLLPGFGFSAIVLTAWIRRIKKLIVGVLDFWTGWIYLHFEV